MLKRTVERILLVNPPMCLEQVYGSLADFGSVSPPVELIRELRLTDIAAQAFTPLPGSDAYGFASEYGAYEENWEKTNSLEDVVYVPHGLTKDMIRDYVNRCYDGCYARLHQYFTLPSRIHTFEHLRFLVRYFLKQTSLVT